MDFGQNLLKLRKEHAMSQEDLAKEIHVTRQTISKWELGSTVPDMDILMDISKLFKVSIDELVGNTLFDTKPSIKKKYVYEYKSQKTLFGLPLIHIHFGPGMYRAKGIIAIGNIATGFLSIGFVSLGIVSLGLLGLGLLSFALVAIGLFFSFGSVAIGGIAFGAIALGYFSFGGVSIGFYSIGGCSIAKNIAYGGYANGKIAIGDVCRGEYIFHTSNNVHDFTEPELRSAILKEFPRLWNIIVEIFCTLGA